MSILIIEVAVCLAFIFLFYQCCVKSARTRGQNAGPFDEHDRGPTTRGNESEDLRRFRERMSERGSGERLRVSSIADRKELIEKNLFSRQIKREESVKELAKLLAISRGGAVDEELGECHAAAAPVESAATEKMPTSKNNDVQPDVVPAASTSESTLPEPSAPPSPAAQAATTATVDTIATAISSQPPAQQQQQQPQSQLPNDSNQPTITLAPIRNLWSNLTHNNNNNTGRETATNNVCTTATSSNNPLHTLHNKLECSICLEQYSPNDTIAWAKDGGDAPTPSSSLINTAVSINNENGCDHIFHRGCLVAWLQDHDECPLCRRKVVHADADVRFAGWEMMTR